MTTNMSSKETVAPKRKRIIGQYFLDLGQKDFSYSTCPVCGLLYARGLEGDEIVHSVFHKNRTKGISFKGWQDERVVSKIDDKGNRVILVLPEDTHHRQKVKQVIAVVEAELGLSPGWLIQKSCKVYLFISSSRKIVGCLMAEPIKNAFHLIPSKKQEVKKVLQQLSVGEKRRSSVNFGGHRSSYGATNLTKNEDQTDSSVTEPRISSEQWVDDLVGKVSKKLSDESDLSNVCLQAGNQSTTEASCRISEEFRTSQGLIAWGATKDPAEVSMSPLGTVTGVGTTFLSTKSRTRKITDFFEQRSNPARVGKDKDLRNPDFSPSLNSVSSIQIRTGSSRGMAASGCTGGRLSKISDYFIGPRNIRSLVEGNQSPHVSCKNVGARVTTGSIEGKEGKKLSISGRQTTVVESVTDVSVHNQVEKKEKDYTASLELEQKGMTPDHLNLQIRDVPESLREPEVASRSYIPKHGFPSTSCVNPKMEIKEEAKLQPLDVHFIRNFSDFADFAGGKKSVQVNLKDEALLKAEMDAVQEDHRDEKSDDSSVDTSVQKKPFKQVTIGERFLLFGNVKFNREVIPRKRSRPEHTEEVGRAVMYNSTPIPAVCGVRVLWVSNSERRKGIASHLLDAMRKTFCLGVVLAPSQFAFSQPTTDGRKFAARYCKTEEFLVYTNS